MPTWVDFETSERDFAQRVRKLFQARKHHVMATLRRDGSPRVSGTEVDFVDGELRIGMMAGAVRAYDLRRDPRVALHSQGVDPLDGDPSSWPGEAKVSGMAAEVDDLDGDGSRRFTIDVREAVLTRLSRPPDHLIIELWTPDRGRLRFDRY